MKNITKFFTMLVASSLTLTSCIEEVLPESSTATAEQVGASSSALEASVSGIPAQMCQGYLVYGDQVHETDMAFPQLLIAMTEMLGDMYPLGENSGYDWYRNYNTFSSNYGDNSYMAYLPWRTLYMFIKTANDVIGAVDITNENLPNDIKGYAGIAYACRAMHYYFLTTLYEPVANIYTDCSDVLGLTVPIVKPETTGDQIKNNPRATHDEMVAFMLEDLQIAESLLSNYTPDTKYMPNLACVYGLMARVYMWDEQYANAATYARKAIDASGCTPLTKEQWLDVNNGFNNMATNNAWMWGIKYSPENMGNLCNFTGHMSGEADWGYSSLTLPGIDKSLYDQIAFSDFRKYTFLDPDRSVYPYETCRDQAWIDDAKDYQAIKFRCLGGDWQDYAVGGAVDVPVMRVEEMYLIEAEALGMSEGVAAGVAALNSFMQTYRDATYNFATTDARTLQLQVLLQMRIEFWGEGTSVFPTAKRLKPGVIRNYEGTNAPADIFKINCAGIKPNWNLVIPYTEVENNVALEGKNNPDPTTTVTGPSPVGEYAPGNNAAAE